MQLIRRKTDVKENFMHPIIDLYNAKWTLDGPDWKADKRYRKFHIVTSDKLDSYFFLLRASIPDSSDKADNVLVELRAVLTWSQNSFCWAISCTKCSREKWVPFALFLYSWALRRNSRTSANQLDNIGFPSSDSPALCNMNILSSDDWNVDC